MILAGIALLLGLSGEALRPGPDLTGATPVWTAAEPTGREVDVELVLAVDMSGSMDLEEARIQRAGYLDALRHREFIDAVRGGLIGRIAISYFEWAGSVNESSRVDWRVIESAADAAAFADDIAAKPITTRRGTSISNALTYASGLIDTNAFLGQRRVIDVSGDGPNNLGPPVVPARDTAVRSGVVVNGLAIIIRPTGVGVRLDRYYGDCVIGGPGSFVLPIHNPDDFGVAIRQKLVMEVSGRQPSVRIIPAASLAAMDCLIGEKMRPGFFGK